MKNQRLKSILLIGAAFLLYGCNEQFLEKGVTPIQTNSSSLISQSPMVYSKTEVPNDAYIVVYKDQTTDREIEDEVGELDKSEGVKADHVYKNALKGFAARLSPTALSKLKNNAKVAFIEKDQVMTANESQVSPIPFPWGIDRIDQANLPLSNSFTYTSDGTLVDAYIIDTGILISHSDFGGRAVGGYSSIGSSKNWIDQNGHGTHVAGTVGGTLYGVAKKVNLIAVRVLGPNGSGTTSGVIAGINWVVSDRKNKSETAVGNMSLGGGASAALDLAVSNAVAAKIVMCVAAGNSKANAANYSPARVAAAITVGATRKDDSFADDYSNYGSIVDILAPGTSITSDWYLNNTSTAILTGTSMATPHVTGVVAQYLSINTNTRASPSTVEASIKSASTKDKITGVTSGTVNALLFTNN
jgi:subtilisin family serine protease